MYYIRISWINGNFMSMMCTHVCDFQFKQNNKDGLFLHASILVVSVCEREICNLNKNNKDDVPIIIFSTMIYIFIACASVKVL